MYLLYHFFDVNTRSYNVEELCADRIKNIMQSFPKADKTRFTVAMFYRFFIPHVLSQEIEKAIYLDSDIIVNLDINELWQYELGDNVLAVVPNCLNGSSGKTVLSDDGFVKPENYFNSGVLMMNLNVLRNEEENLLNGIKFIGDYYDSMPDQDVLNYCFSTRALHLPVKFNRLIKWARHAKETQIKPMIYHCSHNDSVRGLGIDMSDPFNRMWMSYFIRTPWFDVDSIGRLCDSFRKLRNNLMDARLLFYKRIMGKSRGFFVDPKKLDSVKKIFSIRDDELIILAENELSLQKLLETMRMLKGKYVFFIMTPEFMKKPFPFNLLTKEGFVDNKDYMKGWYYFSEANGGSFNTKPFIQAM
ncbi:MAG: hypothetical protein SR1Q7_01115 [Quinella sp. 1Q7]|nr:hypothetical protein [Quinella sp. 1Q7]